MFRRLDDNTDRPVRLEIDGLGIEARSGETIAAAMLAAGLNWFRTMPVSGHHRGPWCLMGVCFDCLVEIDGLGLRQACQTVVRDGMRVSRPTGPRKVAP